MTTRLGGGAPRSERHRAERASPCSVHRMKLNAGVVEAMDDVAVFMRCGRAVGIACGDSSDGDAFSAVPAGTAENVSELLVAPKIPPLTDGQRTERHAAAAHSFQPSHYEAHELAHATDLAFAAFAQHEAQLMLVLP